MMFSSHETSEKVPAFLSKLWIIVEDEKTNDLIRWGDDGTSFIISNQADFSFKLLPQYYKHNNMASFIRQLNMYGFRKKLNPDSGALKPDKDEIEFYHPHFTRGNDQNLELIKRKMTNSTKATWNAITPVHPVTDDAKLNQVMSEVSALKKKHETVVAQMTSLKAESQHAWNMYTDLQNKFDKQQQIIKKLMHLIVTVMQQPSPLGRSINKLTGFQGSSLFAGATNVPAITHQRRLADGPIIHEVTDDVRSALPDISASSSPLGTDSSRVTPPSIVTDPQLILQTKPLEQQQQSLQQPLLSAPGSVASTSSNVIAGGSLDGNTVFTSASPTLKFENSPRGVILDSLGNIVSGEGLQFSSDLTFPKVVSPEGTILSSMSPDVDSSYEDQNFPTDITTFTVPPPDARPKKVIKIMRTLPNTSATNTIINVAPQTLRMPGPGSTGFQITPLEVKVENSSNFEPSSLIGSNSNVPKFPEMKPIPVEKPILGSTGPVNSFRSTSSSSNGNNIVNVSSNPTVNYTVTPSGTRIIQNSINPNSSSLPIKLNQVPQIQNNNNSTITSAPTNVVPRTKLLPIKSIPKLTMPRRSNNAQSSSTSNATNNSPHTIRLRSVTRSSTQGGAGAVVGTTTKPSNSVLSFGTPSSSSSVPNSSAVRQRSSIKRDSQGNTVPPVPVFKVVRKMSPNPMSFADDNDDQTDHQSTALTTASNDQNSSDSLALATADSIAASSPELVGRNIDDMEKFLEGLQDRLVNGQVTFPNKTKSGQFLGSQLQFEPTLKNVFSPDVPFSDFSEFLMSNMVSEMHDQSSSSSTGSDQQLSLYNPNPNNNSLLTLDSLLGSPDHKDEEEQVFSMAQVDPDILNTPLIDPLNSSNTPAATPNTASKKSSKTEEDIEDPSLAEFFEMFASDQL